MTSASIHAFKAATGHSPDYVYNYITGFLVALLFLWAAWMIGLVMRSLMSEDEEAKVAWTWVTVRISVLIAITVWMVV
ncbi:MAG TPA: TIGR03758 family integrating conjugative element protein [Rhodobacteraceae bacterium]|nr:TIGR03758 family integrating conjugative element protein [Paracoccaceae bacterium]